MKKFDKLLEKIKKYNETMLDLTDFGILKEQVDDLVIVINSQPKINFLILNHNELDDSSVQSLAKLKNIIFLDIGHNNFTQQGVVYLRDRLLQVFPKFKLSCQQNNTGQLFFFNSQIQNQEFLPKVSENKDTGNIDPALGVLFSQMFVLLKKFRELQKELPIVKQVAAQEKLIDMVSNSFEVVPEENRKENKPD